MGADITEDNGKVFLPTYAMKKLLWNPIWLALSYYNKCDIVSKVVEKSDIIFICVKPHILGVCASQIRRSIGKEVEEKDKLFVSVLAGCTLNQLEQVNWLQENLKLSLSNRS